MDTIKDMLKIRIPTCFKVADLGCSSGPNTLLVISEIIDTIHEMCQQTNTESPEFLVLLNDLPENDLNAIFKTLPAGLRRQGRQVGALFYFWNTWFLLWEALSKPVSTSCTFFL